MRDRAGNVIITADQQGGVYVISKIAPQSDSAFLTTHSLGSDHEECCHSFPAMDIEPDHSLEATQDKNPEITTSSKRDLYKLWHRRFGHLGSAKLRNLHQVTTLKKPIPIAEDHGKVCRVCALTKIVNKRDHHVSERKTSILALISIDVCGPLPLSRLGYSYFLQVVDNYSRRSWILPIKNRTDCVEALDQWKRITELQTGAKLRAVRSDNAPELKKYIDD